MSSQPVECDLPRFLVSFPARLLERQRLLRQYRANFHAAAHSSTCQVTYDLACQYLKNMHEVQKAAADLAPESDRDSIISDDSGPPPLEPREASPIADIPPFHVPSMTAPSATTTDGEQVEKWYEYWTNKVDGFGEWGIPGSLLGDFRGGHTDGEGIERAWASVGRQQTDDGNLDDGTVDSHHLQIISLHGIRDVDCTCHDSRHSKYTRQEAYAFADEAGHVVVKKIEDASVAALLITSSLYCPLHLLCFSDIFWGKRRCAKENKRRNKAANKRPGVPQGAYPGAVRLTMSRGNSSPIRAPNSSPGRAPNASQRVDAIIEYEVRPGELARDTGLFVSRDGKRVTRIGLNEGLKKRKVKPSDLDDAYGDWVPLPPKGYSEEADEDADNIETGGKRKRNGPGETMRAWRPLVQRFLDEFLRWEGLGGAMRERSCSCCRVPWESHARRFRCRECGVFIQCLECVLTRHTLTPLHKLQEWRGRAWFPTTLESLGSVYQLGHGGHPCKHPAPAVRTMIVIDIGHIHSVKFRYCACNHSDTAQNLEQLLRNDWYLATTVDPVTCATFASLEMFRLLNVVGNINVKDYVGTLEQLTNACDVRGVPDRYKAFASMARQHAFLTRLKRAGRGHDPAGVAGTKNGECAVQCWCCPHDNINLPEGWRDVAPEFRFLYMIVLAMDANFRLKNRLRANEHEDRPLGSGWGHLVEEAPYKEHLKGYVAEKDYMHRLRGITTNGHSLDDRTSVLRGGRGGVRATRGCATTGGWGLAERGTIRQYGLHIVVRNPGDNSHVHRDLVRHCLPMENQFPGTDGPEAMCLDLGRVNLLYGLPVWHAAAHERKCQIQNSLTYIPGVGRTNGEGIERTWSGFNPMAGGARADAFEDKIDHHNFLKNINQAFKDVDSTLKKSLRKKWQKKIDDWIKDPSKPNPYELEGGQEGGPSEAAIRLSLTQEEAREAAIGGGKLHGSSVTSFLTAGLQLEESQRRIRTEPKGRALLVSNQSERVAEIRRAFFVKLSKFRKLQEVYMPAAVREVEREEDLRDADLPPPKAEEVKLYLPSGLGTSEREEGCRKGLAAMEAKLREGQCRDALIQMRSRLHAKRHLITYRDTAVAGQHAATWAYTLIERVGERVDALATKYRRAREALIALQGRAACGHLKELKAGDIQLDEEQEVDARVQRKLGEISSKSSRRQGGGLSSKEKMFSWIWTEGGGPGRDEEELHDCKRLGTDASLLAVRVEWSKAKARKERWEEEVELLREEMKRVLRFLWWHTMWWEIRRATRREGVTPELLAGLQAYAARQAAIHREITRGFKRVWDQSVETVVQQAVQEDVLVAEGMTTFVRMMKTWANIDGCRGGGGQINCLFEHLEYAIILIEELFEGREKDLSAAAPPGGHKPAKEEPLWKANYVCGYTHLQRLYGTTTGAASSSARAAVRGARGIRVFGPVTVAVSVHRGLVLRVQRSRAAVGPRLRCDKPKNSKIKVDAPVAQGNNCGGVGCQRAVRSRVSIEVMEDEDELESCLSRPDEVEVNKSRCSAAVSEVMDPATTCFMTSDTRSIPPTAACANGRCFCGGEMQLADLDAGGARKLGLVSAGCCWLAALLARRANMEVVSAAVLCKCHGDERGAGAEAGCTVVTPRRRCCVRSVNQPKEKNQKKNQNKFTKFKIKVDAGNGRGEPRAVFVQSGWHCFVVVAVGKKEA
ncbi:hypothetical protein DFH07DRAFT_783991 [Mycena maculata]|uniref:CxC2-like cysteine cluster KDZ transposase-associated domain-containing protein n=1 Tax=Mycena maculata TaxID=230809 RepID=A0AAD7HJ75_9AGAR|nr:hypothetical protein DFH07DRAFT_783991 [Mycena maculata]